MSQLPAMTPFDLTIENELNVEVQRFNNGWLFRWYGMTYSGGQTDVDDFRGGRIHYTSIKFGRQQRQVFWEAIDRYLDRKVHETFRQWDAETRGYSIEVRRQSLDSVERTLRRFVSRIVAHGKETDRRLRGNGHPERVPPADDVVAHVYTGAEISNLATSHRMLLDHLSESEKPPPPSAKRGGDRGGIFISYRREDSAPWAGRTYDRLTKEFGSENVFLDVAGIPPGEDFHQVIIENVGACDALIALIGRQWLTSADGVQRLNDPNDFVRIEIEAALERNVRIIPVLVDGVRMPKAIELPDSLKRLARKQAIEISHNRFDADVERLAQTLASVQKLIRRAANRKDSPAPRNAGALTARVDLLFSPEGSGVGLVPKLQIGESNVFFEGPAGEFGRLLFPALAESQFKVEAVGGKIKVSTILKDGEGNLLAEINRNEWQVAPPPRTWDRNYSHDSLEVRDSSGRVVLQVRVVADRIQIQGSWWIKFFANSIPTLMTILQETTLQQGAKVVFTPKGSEDSPPEIEAMFVYPSELHLGELRSR